MRSLRVLLIAFALLETSGLAPAVLAIVEHVDCEAPEGDGCCAGGCTDGGACDDCACCFHFRPMILAGAFAPAPGGPALDAELAPASEATPGYPGEILHVPRYAV